MASKAGGNRKRYPHQGEMQGAPAFAVQSGQLAPEAFEGSSQLPAGMQQPISRNYRKRRGSGARRGAR